MFSRPRENELSCVAHIRNQMGRVDGHLEKGAADGALVGQTWRERDSLMQAARPKANPAAPSTSNYVAGGDGKPDG